MTALSAMVFALSWWLGLYLLARDPAQAGAGAGRRSG